MFEEILTFWFKETEPRKWWVVDSAFDDLLKTKFHHVLTQAAFGELCAWRATARGRLAEIIILDQFSRNIYRGTPQAFSQDAQALVLAQEAVAAGALGALEEVERTFLLMPYMHSESPAIHVQAEVLFKAFAPPGNFEFELRHKAIIDRFGRYPHRNNILSRVSSAEEIEFLQQPGASF